MFWKQLKSGLRRRLGFRKFQAALGDRGTAPRRLIAYLPTAQQGWILDFLWKDLCQKLALIEDVQSGIASSPEDLWRQCQGTDLIVVAMGLKFLNELIGLGFPPDRIIFYHTHVRLGLEIKKLDLLHAVLVLNSFEGELVAMRKVKKSKIHRFPAGYDQALFSLPQEASLRAIDVLFVGRYRQGKDGYYHKRKRYGFQVALADQLLELGLKVAFLGRCWDQCEYPLNPKLRHIDVPHSQYSEIYQQTQIVCSVSGQEGGPVSFLEGMACDCLMLSVPTGFVTDLQLSDVACWTMPILASEKHWAGEITRILRDHPFVTDEEQIARQTFLLDAQFSALAQQLVQICWPTDEPAKIFALSDE